MDGTVIIADDDKNLRAVLTQSLTRAGVKVRATATLSTLWRWLEEGEGEVVLCDVNLADGDALDLLPKMKNLRPDLQFVMMSAQNTVITALRASEAGAFEYLAKPFDLREMIEVLARAKQQTNRTEKLSRPEENLALPLIGRSEVMQELYKNLARMIPSDLPVLITGESGTGKTLTAEIIHAHGLRKEEAFCVYDGSGGQDYLVEEAFLNAGNGTLLLDKIEDFLPSEQLKVVRLIESRRFGARLIATASENLFSLVEEGYFRQDLYHHINVLSLNMPRLRDRIEDIGELAEFFAFELVGGQKTLETDAISTLQNRMWPGNVKQLKSAISRIVVMSTTDRIGAQDVVPLLPDETSSDQSQSQVELNFSKSVESYVRRFLKIHGNQLPSEGFYEELIGQVDRPAIEVVLEMTGGNQIKAAQILGINRNTLRKKIQNLDISVTKGKKLM